MAFAVRLPQLSFQPALHTWTLKSLNSVKVINIVKKHFKMMISWSYEGSDK